MISLEDYLKHTIQTVKEQEYHKLVLLVGDFSSGKTQLMRHVCDEIGGVYLNVNLELTRQLLTIDARTYATKASVLLNALCDAQEGDCPLFLDNIELLFSPEVGRLNPVDLFKKVSRERVVVLSLPCRLTGRTRAEYSEPGRRDHMNLDLSGFTVIELEGGM
jgi:Cdc6-like AAA superfamily ATPase